jgi:hypothetical protein
VSSDSTPTAPVTARIKHEDIARLREIAEVNGSTVSRLVSRCVTEHIPMLPVAIRAHHDTEQVAA